MAQDTEEFLLMALETTPTSLLPGPYFWPLAATHLISSFQGLHTNALRVGLLPNPSKFYIPACTNLDFSASFDVADHF